MSRFAEICIIENIIASLKRGQKGKKEYIQETNFYLATAIAHV